MSTGSILGIEEYAERYWKWASDRLKRIPVGIRSKGKIAALMFALFYSGYLAWNDEHQQFLAEQGARQTAEGQVSELRRQLSASSPSELQSRIDRLERKNSELTAELDAQRWAPISPAESVALKASLAKISPEPVLIACATINCKALTESIAAAFKGAGWPNITVQLRGGFDVTGVTGLVLEPAEKETNDIRTAIQGATKLEIPVPQDKRSGAFMPGLFFAIGEKPF